MDMRLSILSVHFFQLPSGSEPVRVWLRELSPTERKIIGEDLKTVQIGWPLGMPLVRKMQSDLWEVRVTLPNKIARLLFTVIDHQLVLLHGFVKKSQATPEEDLQVAIKRLKLLKEQK